jgi:hypothetical protein
VNITGILAQMGRGMVEDVSDQMFQIFAQRLRGELEAGAAGAAAAPAAPAGQPAATGPAAAAGTATAAGPPEALDLGSLGAKVAGRAATRFLSRPVPLWVALLLGAIVVYLLLR